MWSFVDLKQCIHRIFDIEPQNQQLAYRLDGSDYEIQHYGILESGIFGKLLSDVGIKSGDTIQVYHI